MDIPHFIHSSIDGALGCFYFLIIMNNAAKNIHGELSMWVYVFLDIYLVVDLLGHVIILCLTFGETSNIFF